MRRPGVDSATALPNDVVCDFCLRDWDLGQPMLAGLDDSLICTSCLHTAYGHIVRLGLDETRSPPDDGWFCVMCRRRRRGRAWPGILTGAVICLGCARRFVRQVNANPPLGWFPP